MTIETHVRMSDHPAIVSHWLPRSPTRAERIKVKCGSNSLMIPIDNHIQDSIIDKTHANAVILFCQQMGWPDHDLIQASLLGNKVFVFIRMVQ